MKITFGILTYLLSGSNEQRRLCGAADRDALVSVAEYDGQPARPGVLYHAAAEGGLLVFAVTKERRLPVHLITTRGGEIALYDPDCAKDMSVTFFPGARNSEALHQSVQEFYTVQDAMTAALMERRDVAAILSPAWSLLRIPYMLISRDMRMLYCHPAFHQLPAILREGEERYVEEITQELMLSKRFHAVAKLTEPFYYQTATVLKNNYCHNILLDREYFARLVLPVPEDEDRLSDGAEQLSGWLAGFCTLLAESGRLRLGRHANDAMHALLRSVDSDSVIDSGVYGEALSDYGWKPVQEYRFLIVRVFNDRDWGSQMEAPLAVICSDLEETWPDSCAAITGQEIHWLIHSASAAAEQSDSDFFRQLAVFVRENVCRVGCSSVFRDIGLLPAAIRQAEVALSLGQLRNPSHWFYRFDDYRFVYMEDAIRDRGLPIPMLVHPAVQTLLEYDAEHESELAQTLHVYLDCHCNATEAADRLFIHRTTLFRRLERIWALTGLDPNDSDETLLLMLSFRLLN